MHYVGVTSSGGKPNNLVVVPGLVSEGVMPTQFDLKSAYIMKIV